MPVTHISQLSISCMLISDTSQLQQVAPAPSDSEPRSRMNGQPQMSSRIPQRINLRRRRGISSCISLNKKQGILVAPSLQAGAKNGSFLLVDVAPRLLNDTRLTVDRLVTRSSPSRRQELQRAGLGRGVGLQPGSKRVDTVPRAYQGWYGVVALKRG